MKGLLVFGALGLSTALVTGVATRAYEAERLNFEPSPPGDLLNHPELTGIRALRNIEFRSADSTQLAGWFAPASNGATVLLLHGTNGDRSSLLWETQALARAGFGVLAFDWPGYGVSQGSVHWGNGERSALSAAVTWLVDEANVDPRRIGALGFSNGGYILAQVAASDPRLRAIALLATPADILEQARWEYRRYGPFSWVPAWWALERSGMLGDPPPERVLQDVAPRPVFIIGGSADQTVPEPMVRELYGAAREPKRLWIVPGARHGHYDVAAPMAYRSQLIDFFTHALVSTP
jgi:dipeptidyl aminopeptidase/acylaminoacyl peptidase